MENEYGDKVSNELAFAEHLLVSLCCGDIDTGCLNHTLMENLADLWAGGWCPGYALETDRVLSALLEWIPIMDTGSESDYDRVIVSVLS